MIKNKVVLLGLLIAMSASTSVFATERLICINNATQDLITISKTGDSCLDRVSTGLPYTASVGQGWGANIYWNTDGTSILPLIHSCKSAWLNKDTSKFYINFKVVGGGSSIGFKVNYAGIPYGSLQVESDSPALNASGGVTGGCDLSIEITNDVLGI